MAITPTPPALTVPEPPPFVGVGSPWAPSNGENRDRILDWWRAWFDSVFLPWVGDWETAMEAYIETHAVPGYSWRVTLETLPATGTADVLIEDVDTVRPLVVGDMVVAVPATPQDPTRYGRVTVVIDLTHATVETLGAFTGLPGLGWWNTATTIASTGTTAVVLSLGPDRGPQLGDLVADPLGAYGVVTTVTDATNVTVTAAGSLRGPIGPSNALEPTGGDDTAAINAFLAAPSPIGVKQFLGNFIISGQLDVPANTYVDARGASFTQTATLTPIFRVFAGGSIFGGRLIGFGAAEWVNSSLVYAACGVMVAGANVTVQNVVATNLAGAGVYDPTPNDRLRVINCTLTGVGEPTLTPGVSQYSGGVVVNNNGSTNLEVSGGSIQAFAQGIVTGSLTNFFIGGGITISSSGQHGIYCHSVVNGVISGVRINTVGLEGIKAQIDDLDPADTDGLIISDVVMVGVRSHGVHIANTQTVPGTNIQRRVVIHDITVKHSPPGIGDSVLLEYVNEATVHDVYGYQGRYGLSVQNSTRVNAHHNTFEQTAQSAITPTTVTDSVFEQNRVIDCCTANNASSNFGVLLKGATTATLRFIGNKFSDANAKMRYGIYVQEGDQTGMSFIDNVVANSTDYGFRSATATTAKLWTGNSLTGTIGAALNPPTNGAAIPDTSGAALAALETEVNKIKARMRLLYEVAP